MTRVACEANKAAGTAGLYRRFVREQIKNYLDSVRGARNFAPALRFIRRLPQELRLTLFPEGQSRARARS